MLYKFEQLPAEVAKVANEYLNITVANKSFPCPYFINKGKRLSHPSLSGKGTAQQIQDLVISESHIFNFDLESSDTDQIRGFMLKHEIGVDCSGLTVRLLDAWLKSVNQGGLFKHLAKPRSLYRKFMVNLRPWSNISADKLTNLENCDKVELNDVRPGDLIRAKGIPKGDHVMMVTSVEKNGDIVKSFEYIQSISKYGDANGVRLGKVNITDINKPLIEQDWVDQDTDGSNPTLEEVKYKSEDNGLRRLKIFNKIWNQQ